MVSRHSVLPPGYSELFSSLDSKDGPAEETIDRFIDRLSALPPKLVVQAEREISILARPSFRQLGLRLFARESPDLGHLKKTPALAWLFLFHADGYVREAALKIIYAPPESPFFFAALALRLNDWVPEVRAAAKRCLALVSPRISSAVAADTALFLFGRRLLWVRWSGEDEALDRVFERPDVGDAIAMRLHDGVAGPLAACLRQALRYPSFDKHLGTLAATAVQPAVRALALGCLIAGKVEWPVGFTWTWIDKVYGKRKQVPVFASRQLECSRRPLAELIKDGVSNRSSAVRIVAADALVKARAEFPDIEVLVRQLASDPVPAVRLRGTYLLQAGDSQRQVEGQNATAGGQNDGQTR
jgi:hypothetical protein